MEKILYKLKSKKGISILCCALFIVVLILFLLIKTNFMKAAPEEITTQETTTEETTTPEPETTTPEPETTTPEPETTTPEPETTTPEPETVTRAEVLDTSNTPYGHMFCSSIGLDCSLYRGSGNSILQKGAAQIPATFMPGYGGLIMVGAHNNTYFNCLQYISTDDVITIETDYGTYNYQVVYTEILDVTGMDAYDFLTDHEQLLLYTCYPFDTLSHTDYRFMVHADLISGPTVIE